MLTKQQTLYIVILTAKFCVMRVFIDANLPNFDVNENTHHTEHTYKASQQHRQVNRPPHVPECIEVTAFPNMHTPLKIACMVVLFYIM